MKIKYGMGGATPEYGAGGKMSMYKEGGKPDFLDLDGDGNRKEPMKDTYEMGGRMYEKGGKFITGQNTSTVRTDQGPDGSTREFVWFDERGNEGATLDAPDGDWARTGAIKVYGNWNEYAAGQNEDGSMFLPDEQFPIMKNQDGSFSLNESVYESSTGGQGASRMEDMQERMMDAGRQGGDPRMMPPLGGQGASPMEDLLERLGQAPSATKFDMGGVMQYLKNKR